MAASEKKTLGQSRSRDQNLWRGWRLIQNDGQGEAVRGSGNKIDEGQIKKQSVKEFFIEQYNDTKARLPTLSKVRCYIVCNLLFVFVVASFFVLCILFLFQEWVPTSVFSKLVVPRFLGLENLSIYFKHKHKQIKLSQDITVITMWYSAAYCGILRTQWNWIEICYMHRKTSSAITF